MEVPTIDNKSRKSAYLRIVDTLASPSLEYYQLENHLGPQNLAPKAWAAAFIPELCFLPAVIPFCIL